MGAQFLMAIDQGTTGTTVLVLDASKANELEVLAKETVEFPQYYPNPSWVEHELDEIWASVHTAMARALAAAQAQHSHFKPQKIAALGLSNQRETLAVYERRSLRALTRAIVWQCKRSLAICQDLKQQGLDKLIREKTGLLLDPYFSGSKVKWLMAEAPRVAAALKSGKAVVGTIDSYLVSRLSGGQSFVTEPSNAARTLLFDIHRGCWDEELCSIFALPSLSVLAEVRDSSGIFGYTKGLGLLPDGIPIAGVLGDQQAALAGQTCFEPGEAKCTYGTGAFLLLQLGKTAVTSKHGLLTTVSWRLKGELSYCLEGSAFIAGAAVQFIRDQLGLLSTAAESEAKAAQLSAAPELYFVPALAGLGAPWWTPGARGAFFGLSRATTQEQIIRATLEGIAFQVGDLLEAISREQALALKVLRVDGGASANNLLMQIQADLARLTVERPLNLESTALGAGLFAGLGVGLYSELEQVKNLRKVDALYQPQSGVEAERRRQVQVEGWRRAVKAVQLFAGTT